MLMLASYMQISNAPEYVDHLLSGCMSIAAAMYEQRHDSIVRIIHWALSR